jgi:hypothetical protein
MPDPRANLSAKAQALLALPEGFKTASPFPFNGMNLQSSPIAIDDKEFLWCENFVRIGDGNLRTLWDAGFPLYTAPIGKTIIYYAAFTIASSYYFAVFLSDGTAVQVAWPSGATKAIAARGSGPFYMASASQNVPCARQWASTWLLISNRNTPADYWVWDGTTLYFAGAAAPLGVNLTSGGAGYSSVPAVTVFGGHGSDLGVTPVINDGSVVEVMIQPGSPGRRYSPGDQVQLQFTGGGSDDAPQLRAYLAPTTLGGLSIATGGVGHTTSDTLTFSGGAGTGAAASITSVDLASGAITGVQLTSLGSGYTSAPLVHVHGGGSNAVIVATLFPSQVAGVAVVDGGSGFKTTPIIQFLGGGGAGAVGQVLLEPTTIASVDVTGGGNNYTAPTAQFTGGGGTGATAQVNLSLPSGGSATKVVSVNLSSGGSGYTSAPTVTFTPLIGGTGATGVANVSGGVVTSITMTNQGSGYSLPPSVEISGGGGAGAAGLAAVGSPPNPVGDNSDGTPGGPILSITVTAGGSNYNQTPQILITDPTGAGAGANVYLTPVGIASVIMSAGGQFYTDAPAVQVQSGNNNAAYATVSLMPYGISGSALEVYLGRVWVVNPAPNPFSVLPPGGNYSFSAGGSVTDFSAADGGGTGTNGDSFLQTKYVNIRQSSGYLYFYGDGSISVVSGLTSAGTPVTTTYQYQNVDPQTGDDWRDTLQDFGRSTIIGNATGLYGVYGGAATKISDKLDKLFTAAPGAAPILWDGSLSTSSKNGLFVSPAVGGVTPSGSIATLFDVKHYLCLLTILDPDTGAQRNVMAVWNEANWTIASQTPNLIFIAPQKVGTVYNTWGTDGASLYPLFAAPSTTLPKRLDTKFYGADHMYIQKHVQSVHMVAQDNSGDSAGVSGEFTFVGSGIEPVNPNFPSLTSVALSSVFAQQPNYQAPAPYWPLWGTSIGGLYFVYGGLRFETTSADITIADLVMGYVDALAYFGQ